MTINYLMNCLRREKQRQNWTLDRLGSCLLQYAGFRSRPPTSVGRALHPFMTPLMGSRLRDGAGRDLSDLASAVTAQISNVSRPESVKESRARKG